MQFTNNEKATYLFCAQLSQTKTTALTILEWNAVVKSLSEHGLLPEELLTISSSKLVRVLTKATEAQKAKILNKVESRQQLGISMLELEEIVHQGYGIMFRSTMPKRLKKLTQKYIPAFFYYAGDLSLLSHPTLGVVGAREANEEELSQTSNIASEAATHGIVIISGGAKGVDSTAVEAALKNGGKAVVFPSEGLTKWVKKSENRQYIMNGQLLLISSQRLDAAFTPAYAMQRNKYIHAPSDAVLVSSSKISGTKNSGTWEGVIENLKHKWAPLYVIGNSAGVKKLLSDGVAKPFSSFEDIFQFNPTTNSIDINNVEIKIAEIIQFALSRGLDKETLEKFFNKALSRHFKSEDQLLGAMVRESEETEKLEQLSIEDLL
jgi:DNA processing protein